MISSLPTVAAEHLLWQVADRTPAVAPILIGQTNLTSIIVLVVGVLLGGGAMLAVNFLRSRDLQAKADALLEKAKSDAANVVKTAELEAKEAELKRKQLFEKESGKRDEQVRKRELAVERKTEALNQTSKDLKKQQQMVEVNQKRASDKIKELSRRGEQLDQVLAKQSNELQKISGLSREEASEKLLKVLENELDQDVGNRILKHERQVAEVAEEKSREIILTAMQRIAAAHTAENTTSSVDIPNDDMKGRIIGREGRNIRALEKATGIDVIIDDTPGVVIVSGFDPVRREVARMSLDK